MTDDFRAGDRWLEVGTGRVVVIARPGPDSPWWHYEDDPGNHWHCCVEDFFVWGRFRRIQ